MRTSLCALFSVLVALAWAKTCPDRFDHVAPVSGPWTGGWSLTLFGNGFYDNPADSCSGLQAITVEGFPCRQLRIQTDEIATCIVPDISTALNQSAGPQLASVLAYFDSQSNPESVVVHEPTCGDGYTSFQIEEECDGFGLGCDDCQCQFPFLLSAQVDGDCIDCQWPPQVTEIDDSPRTYCYGLPNEDVFDVHVFDGEGFAASAGNSELYLAQGYANCAGRHTCPACIPHEAQVASECVYVEILSLVQPIVVTQDEDDPLTSGILRDDVVTATSPISIKIPLNSVAFLDPRYSWVPRLRYWDQSEEEWVPAGLSCPPELRGYYFEEDSLTTMVCKMGPPVIFRAFWEVEKDIFFETFIGARDCQPPAEWQNRNLLDLDYPKMLNQMVPVNAHHVRDEDVLYVPPTWCFGPSTSRTAQDLLERMDFPVAYLWAEGGLDRHRFPEDQALETRPFSTNFVDFSKWRVMLEFDTTFLPGPGASAAVEAATADGGWVHVYSWGGELDDAHIILDITSFHSSYNSETERVEGAAFNRLRFRWRGNGQFGWFVDNVRVFMVSMCSEEFYGAQVVLLAGPID